MTLTEWETRWTLNGDHLHCNCCQVAQWPWNSTQAYHHADGCPAEISSDEYPWQDLAVIARTELSGPGSHS